MLELSPTGLSGRRYTVSRDGEDIAHLSFGWVREGAEVTIDGAPHELRHEGLGSGAFELSHHGAVVARARKPSAFRKRFELEHEGRVYELAKESWWGRAFELRADGHRVGSVRPVHPFTRRASIDLPEELSLPVRVFAAALVALLWRRGASAAAAGGGAAAAGS